MIIDFFKNDYWLDRFFFSRSISIKIDRRIYKSWHHYFNCLLRNFTYLLGNAFGNMRIQFQCHGVTTCRKWLSDAKLLNYPSYFLWVNISIAHILGFFRHFKNILFQFFFEHVVDEFWKTNPRLVLQETPPPRSLGPSVHYDRISVHYEGIMGHYDGITMQYHV